MNKLACAAIIFTSITEATAYAATTILPVSDGDIQICGDSCTLVDSSSPEMISSSYLQAIVKFPQLSTETMIESALLSVHRGPYQAWWNELSIYGYSTDEKNISTTDRDAGEYIGTFTLPETFYYSGNAYFDVTSFVKGATGPYLSFNIRAPNSVSMGTLESSGGPAKLIITTAVPEANTGALAAIGMALIGIFFRNKKQVRRVNSEIN